MQTFAAFYVIVNTTTLTYSILTVMKRAVLIVGRFHTSTSIIYSQSSDSRSLSIMYYRNPTTFWHIVGLIIAFFGVSWYTQIKLDMKRKKQKDSPLSEADKMELGLKP